VPVPRLVIPSRKVTVPVGVPLPEEAATVAVRVTLCAAATVVADAANVVSVEPGEVPPPEEDCSRKVPEPSRSILHLQCSRYLPEWLWEADSASNRGGRSNRCCRCSIVRSNSRRISLAISCVKP
jgi:hypothetical protein